MATIEPFRGLRFNPVRVADLSRVIAPPYDVISNRERELLRRQDPHNIVRLILPKDPPQIAHGDRYRMAASYLDTWIEEEVLVEDDEPAIYVLDNTFMQNGEPHTRRGFVAAVKLEPFGEGSIFPHEETLPGPKADRLKLLRSTKTNLSPIFALYPDDGTVLAVVDTAPMSEPLAEAVDGSDVRSTLRRITDPNAIAELQQAMSSRHLLIADGHHRYETALNYRGPKPTGGPADYVMMACTSSLDPGLLILPTHRMARPEDEFDEEEFFGKAAENFALSRLGGSEAHPADVLLDALRQLERHAFGVYTSSGTMAVMRPLDEQLPLTNPAPHSDEWKQLDVALLHEFVLHRVLGIGPRAAKGGECVRYTRDASEAIEIVSEGLFDVAFLLKPTRIEQMKSVAGRNERMPPKSTYFYPKLPTGLVLRRL